MFRGERFQQTLQHVAEIRGLTDPFYGSLAEAAVRFVLDRPDGSTTIIGTTSIDQIERNVGFGDGRGLDEVLRERLSGVGWKRNFST